MGKPKAPKAPDYAAAAQAQGEANLNSTLATNYLNQPNQVGPDGSLTFTYDTAGGHRLPDGTIIPRTTATTTLSPAQQKLYDQNNAISTALNDLAQRGIGYVDQASSTQIDQSGMPGLNSAPAPRQFQEQYDFSQASRAPTFDDFATDRDRVTEALMSRMRPELERQRQARETVLANQGLNMGSEAYSREQSQLGQNENDAFMQSIIAGSGEQQRQFENAMNLRNQGIGEAMSQGDLFNQAQQGMFNQGLASRQFGNAARSQAIQEADYFKNQPLNMLNALRSGNQVSMPQFGNVSTGAQVQAAPIYAATNDQYNAQMDAYNAKMANYGALLGGLGSLGGAAITKFSDRRLKVSIRKLWTKANGLGVYTYSYIGSKVKEFGYMADEVRKIFPEAIVTHPSGYLMVDYGKVR